MLLEISGEITLERMKGWGQSKNNHPVVDVTGDRSKVLIIQHGPLIIKKK